MDVNSSPEPPDKHSSRGHLDLGLVVPPEHTKPAQSSDSQDWKLLGPCCLNLLHLWQRVTQQWKGSMSPDRKLLGCLGAESFRCLTLDFGLRSWSQSHEIEPRGAKILPLWLPLPLSPAPALYLRKKGRVGLWEPEWLCWLSFQPWLRLRAWYQGCEIQPCIMLHALQGVWESAWLLLFPPSRPHSCARSLS